MPLPLLTLEQLLRFPPTILGTIRWKKSVGAPAGDYCSGFDIRVEEHTTTDYLDGGGGQAIPDEGTGIYKPVPDSVTCRPGADYGDEHSVSFQVTGLHFNAFPDGFYRITPTLKGNWRPSGLLAPLVFRLVEPFSDRMALTEDAPVKHCAFEVTRRGWFSGRRF